MNIRAFTLTTALTICLYATTTDELKAQATANSPQSTLSDKASSTDDILSQIIASIKAQEIGTLSSILSKIGTNDVRFSGDQYSIIYLAQGIVAAARQDYEGAERLFKEAFWQDPDIAEIVARFSEETRMHSRMKGIRVNLDSKFATSDGKTTSLREVASGQKYLLLDFWASWCAPCMRAMPELKQRHADFGNEGVQVIAINTEADAEKAEMVRTELKMSMAWLMDNTDEPLAKLLWVTSIPRAVLIDGSGRVLFNGHPSDKKLAATLETLKSNGSR